MGGFVNSLSPTGPTAQFAQEEEGKRQQQIAEDNASREHKAPWEGPGFMEMFVGAEKQGLLPKAFSAYTDAVYSDRPAPTPGWVPPVMEDSRVPDMYKLGLFSATNKEDYEQRVANMQDEMRYAADLANSNGLGKIGAFMGTVATPEMFFSGALEAITIGKTVHNLSRINGAFKSASVMAASGGVLEGLNVATSETKPYEDILTASVMSGLFGGVLGATKVGRKLLVGEPVEPFKVRPEFIYTTKAVADEAAAGTRSYLPAIGTPEFAEAAAAKTAERVGKKRTLGKRLANISMGDDVHYNSSSGHASEAMYRLGEVSNHDVTKARPNTAAVDADIMRRQLGEVMVDYDTHYHSWAAERNLSMKDHRFSGEGHEMFGREVIMELEHMKATGQKLSTSPSVRAMADEMVPQYNASQLKVLKESGVTGASKVQDDPLYWHRRWKFAQISNAHSR